MAYEPTQWKRGDIVTSEKLNKMEQGISGGDFVVNFTKIAGEEPTADKTFAEISEAIESGANVKAHMTERMGTDDAPIMHTYLPLVQYVTSYGVVFASVVISIEDEEAFIISRTLAVTSQDEVIYDATSNPYNPT